MSGNGNGVPLQGLPRRELRLANKVADRMAQQVAMKAFIDRGKQVEASLQALVREVSTYLHRHGCANEGDKLELSKQGSVAELLEKAAGMPKREE